MFVMLIVALICNAFNTIDALANCPVSCECDDDLLVVQCSEGSLDILPITLNPLIKRLAIHNNKIKTIDSSIQFYAELSFLDLSYNHLLNIPPRTFLYQKKLQELHLNHNKISLISNQTFIGLNTLTSLNLRGNFIGDLSMDVFSTLPKLEELNLAQNRIARIDRNAFRSLSSLRVLYLNDNTLSAVPSEAFAQLTTLAELYLGINSFTVIEADAFERLHGLNTLDLKGAQLYNISVDTFRGLERSLRKLDLSDNRLAMVPTVALSTLIRLEELSLGQNDFEVIPKNAFSGLTNLRHLDITGSLKLKTIQSDAFATNTNLESLTLVSNTALSNIEDGALSGLPHLKHCTLRGNSLSAIPESLFPWAQLETFDFSENPIFCDCHIAWLRILLISKNATQTMQENVLCAAPDSLHKEPLKTLSADILGCSTIESHQEAIVGVLVMGVAVIVTAVAILFYKCRRQLRDVVDGKWGNSAMGHKEREYQKTFADEDFIHAAARHPSLPCGLGVHQQTTLANCSQYPHQYHHPSIRPIPVTEL